MEKRNPSPVGTTTMRRRPSPGDGKANSCAKKRNSTRILIVEEGQPVTGLLFQMLSGKGYKVEAAETAAEAYEKLKGRSYEMVIAGRADGETTSLIQTFRKAAPKTCVVIIEDQPGRRARKRDDDFKADLVIPMPIDMTSTLHRISEALIGRAK